MTKSSFHTCNRTAVPKTLIRVRAGVPPLYGSGPHSPETNT
jgi:hypothetical protein